MLAMGKKTLIIGYVTAVLLFLSQQTAFASEYTVRPFLFDEIVNPRDVITETVLLTNDSEYRKYIVYATVNEISVDKEGEIKKFVSPVMTDRSNTITSWIEVTRGRIEIPPGESREVPVTFRINHDAEPGEYHAFIGFVPAPNKPEAQRIALNGEADGVVVKITVADQRKDNLRIDSFLIDRFVTDDDGRNIEIVVENSGDLPSAPNGEIIFYDSKGVEVDSLMVNEDESIVVAPGETKTITATLPLGDELGRFKANINLKYGKNQSAALFDTTTFYMMPIHLLLMIFGAILIVALFVAYLFKRTFINDDYDDGYGDEVALYVREGHDAKPMDHDIDLKNKS